MKIGWHGIGEGALADKAGVVEVARTLERAGFESAWIGEHPVLVDPQTPPSPLDPTTNLIDPMVALTAAAAVTERLSLAQVSYCCRCMNRWPWPSSSPRWTT